MIERNTQKWVWLFVVLAGAMSYNTPAMGGERFSLSLRNLEIQREERIVQFRVTITHGFVTSVPRLRPGWFIHVDLPLQFKTVVTAGSIIGVADLTWHETKYFNDFLIIEASEDEEDLLSVEVEIVTNTLVETRDSFIKRSYLFNKKELELRKLKN